jgi:hypothetical protein
MAVVPGDDFGRISEEDGKQHRRSLTPPTRSRSMLKIRHGSAGRLGTYEILSVLPDKSLFEFHGHRLESLDRPVLPADRSDFDVHGLGALLDDKVPQYVML